MSPSQDRARHHGEPPALVDDPTWLPHEYDLATDTLTFAHLPREAQRQLTFLSPRFMSAIEKSPPIPLSDLGDCVSAQPMHFIFHTAFCCSTLLTRALDVPGVSMGLKEPAIIASLASHWMTSGHRTTTPRALSTSLNLLSRPLSPTEVQIVKPTNAANFIAAQLLHTQGARSKAILLYSNLEVHLSAIARRGEEGAVMARSFLAGFQQTIPFRADGSKPLDAALLTDLQAASAAWLMNMAYFAELKRCFGRDRVRVLNADALIADPARTLKAVADFFDLPPEGWDDVAASDVFAEHAKRPSLRFDAEAYRAQNMASPRRSDLSAAYDYARKLSGQFSAPMSLADTLFS